MQGERELHQARLQRAMEAAAAGVEEEVRCHNAGCAVYHCSFVPRNVEESIHGQGLDNNGSRQETFRAYFVRSIAMDAEWSVLIDSM